MIDHIRPVTATVQCTDLTLWISIVAARRQDALTADIRVYNQESCFLHLINCLLLYNQPGR